jgi:hypothetical protein
MSENDKKDMCPTLKGEFNFDAWMELYKKDPEEFERRREMAVRRLIDSRSGEGKARLEGLQFQVDVIRRKAKNPMQATIEISAMMEESFFRLNDALQGNLEPVDKSKKADVLEFKPKGT